MLPEVAARANPAGSNCISPMAFPGDAGIMSDTCSGLDRVCAKKRRSYKMRFHASNFESRQLGMWMFRPCAVLLGILLSSGGCAFKVDLPIHDFDVGGGRGEDVGIDASEPDLAEDSGGPEVVGPTCKTDMDCEGKVPAIGMMPQCRQWGCDKKAGLCDWVPLGDGTACDGGSDACVKSWKCMGGECQAHSYLNCDDKNPCTTDFCSPDAGCGYGNADGSLCNDGLQCTTGDSCQEGQCKGKENCPSQDPCEVGQCNEDGFCVYYATPGRPGCGGCYDWGLPGPEGEMIVCCQGFGPELVPRMFCGEGQFPCGGMEDPGCKEACEAGCATNQQICVPCGNGVCEAFENVCNCEEDCSFQVNCEGDWNCPEGMVCIGGVCQPNEPCTSEEICGDDQDNDCDGKVDEPDCVGMGCAMPGGYFPTTVADLVAVNPSAKPGTKVSFSAVANIGPKIGTAPCDGACCPVTKFLLKLTDGGVKFVVLKNGGCQSDTCSQIPQCDPTEGKYYLFFGTYQKEPVEGVGPAAIPVLYADGWCLQ